MKRTDFGLKLKTFLRPALVLFAALLLTFSALPVQAYTGDPSELEGIWHFNTLSTGLASHWARGTMTVQADGSYTLAGTNMSGNSISFSGTISATEDGLSMNLPVSTNNLCQVDMNQTLIVCTQTESDGAITLIVGTKEAPNSYAQADLTGTWQFNRLSSGAQNQWQRSVLTVKPTGAFSDSQVNSDGTTKKKTGALSIAPSDGEITPSCPSCTDSDESIVMDSGKTIIAETGTKSDAETAQLGVFAKKAKSYSLTDVAGTWKLNSISTGDDPRWKRATLNIAADGSFTFAGTESDGSTSSQTGKVSISNAGIITCPSCKEPSFQMVMDSGKTVIVGTETTGSGNYQMSILVRDPLTISGSVKTSAGAPIPGVSVTLTAGPGTQPSTVTTDGDGAYSFTGLLNGTYQITPSISGYVFNPKSVKVTLKGQNVTQVITGAPVVIPGKVQPYKGRHETVGQQGVTVNLSLNGVVIKTINTDSNGNFLFSTMPNGTYTITPVPPTDHAAGALSFVPAQLKTTVTGKNANSSTFKYKTNATCTRCH